MSTRSVHSRSPSPARTPDAAQNNPPTHSSAQRQPRLRSDAGNDAGTSVLDQLGAHEYDDKDAAMSDHDAHLLQSLHERLTGFRPPLSEQVDDIIDLFAMLKLAERKLRSVLIHHPHAPRLMRLKRSLSMLIRQLGPVLRQDPASLSLAQIQTLCQGLSACVPSSAGELFHPQSSQQDKLCLQSLTDTLLSRAMALGLPEAVQANGEVLDILNWVSRGLKAGLLEPGEAIDLCFEKALVLMEAWTGGDQCRQLLSDHNVGRVAVQCATIFNHTTLDLRATVPAALSEAANEPNGQRLQRCILNLGSNAVLKRLAAAPVDTVSLLNVCNTIKDAIEKRIVADTDPALPPVLDRLVRIIAGLPERELIGVDQDCRPLSNFSNFLRTLAERRVRQELVFHATLPVLESAACTLIACVSGTAFAQACPGYQPLSNLVSFVKLCDKLLTRHAAAATTASATASSTGSVTPLITRDALIEAGRVLIWALLERGVAGFSTPEALGGLLAGLAYLWQRNLAPRSAALQEFAAALLEQAGKTRQGSWNEKSKATVLPALQTLLQLEIVMLEAVQPALARMLPKEGTAANWPTAQDLAREIKRLGVVEEVVEPPPPAVLMPAPARPAPVAPATADAARMIPGLTPIRPAPVYRPETTASASTSSTSASGTGTRGAAGKIDRPFQTPRKVAKPGRAKAGVNSYNVSTSGAGTKASDTDAAADDAATDDDELVASKLREAAAEKGKTAHKNQGVKNRKAGINPGRMAPHARDTALCKALIQGKPEQVEALMGQTATWSQRAITTLLDALMRELILVDKDLFAALDRFFSGVIMADPVKGPAALTAYFLTHPSEFDFLQNLLADKQLMPDLRKHNTPAKLLDLFTSANPEALALWLRMPAGLIRLNEKTASGKTLLHLAVMRNCPQFIEIVLAMPQAAGMVHQETHAGLTPLIVAAFHGYESVVRALLSHASASAQARRINTCGVNALMTAADKGHSKVVSLLLADSTAAEQASAVNRAGMNPLLLAVRSGHTDVVSLLLDSATASEQASVVLDGGVNALMLAAGMGHVEVVKVLLAHPETASQVSAVNKFGENALMLAAQKEGSREAVWPLLAHASAGAQLAVFIDSVWALLKRAIGAGQVELVSSLLLDNNAVLLLAVRSSAGWRELLLFAEQTGNETIIALVRRAQPDAQ